MLWHTFASLLLHEGCGRFIVADQMGHRSLPLLEDTYGHIIKGLRRNISMNDAITEARNPEPDVRSKCDTGNVVDLAAHPQAKKTA